MRNLLGRLHERSPSSLAGIAREWGVELRGRDIHQDVGQLFRVMTDPWSFAMTLERLDPEPRALLNQIIQLRGSRTGHQIAEQVGSEFAAIRGALQTLFRSGFLYAEQSEAGVDEQGEVRLLVPREIAGLFERVQREKGQSDPDRAPLNELLDRLDDADLAEIATEFGYTVIPAIAQRADLIDFIRPRLSDPERISRSRNALSGPAARLSERLETIGRDYPSTARSALMLTPQELRSAIWDLAALGLIWRGYDEQGKLQIVFPTAIRVPTPIPKTPPPALERVDADQVEEPEWIHPFSAAWDLLIVLRETQVARSQGLARMLRDGGQDLTSAAITRLASMLWMSSARHGRDQNGTVPRGYLWFLSALATGEGLIDEADPPGLTDNVRPWTRLDFPTQQRRLVASWLRWSHWYEARGRDSVEVWGARWAEFRRSLVDQLAVLTVGRWYTMASFAERFAAEHPDALGTQFSAALNREHVDGTQEARRRDVVRMVAEMTLLTAGTWLQLIETGRVRQRGYVFRVTEAGRWALGLHENVPEEPAFGDHSIAVQANFHLLLTRPEPRLVWSFSGFADLIELDRVSTFELTEESIHRAIDAGATVDQILRALARYGGESVPENVIAELEEWAASYRHARISSGIIVQLSHSAELQRLNDTLSDQGLTVEPLANDRLFIHIVSEDRRESTIRVLRTVLSDLGIAGRWG